MIRLKRVTSMITLGIFVEAISSTLDLLIVSMVVGKFQNWHLIFGGYAILSLFLATCSGGRDKIRKNSKRDILHFGLAQIE